jgi:hypothetical protein
MESNYRGHRFPPEIICHAIWLYHRFTLSFRDVEDLLAERGITRFLLLPTKKSRPNERLLSIAVVRVDSYFFLRR